MPDVTRPFLEMELALLLGKLLGSPNEAAIAVFQIIRRSSTQRDAILEAVATALIRRIRNF